MTRWWYQDMKLFLILLVAELYYMFKSDLT